MLRGYHEETAPVEFRLKAFLSFHLLSIVNGIKLCLHDGIVIQPVVDQ